MPTELRDCAEDSKILERASDLYAERPNRGRRYRRAGSAHQIRGERAPYSFGLKEPNAGRSRCNRLSRSLGNERHNTEELPGIHPRVDQGTTRRELRKANSRVFVRQLGEIGSLSLWSLNTYWLNR